MISLNYFFSLFLSIACGAAIGYDREKKDHAAGMRTHMLICMGAAITIIVASWMFDKYYTQYNVTFDIFRLGAQVISGIGFICGGTIIYSFSYVKGLTTSASLWIVACIGIVCGSGMYLFAVIATVVVFLILQFTSKDKVEETTMYVVTLSKSPSAMRDFILLSNQLDIGLTHVVVKNSGDDQCPPILHVDLILPNDLNQETALACFKDNESILAITPSP